MEGEFFFRRMEREINFQKEYEKIDSLIINQGWPTIEARIEENFLSWPRRMNYLSFYELREHLGFSYSYKDSNTTHRPLGCVDKLSDFLTYCEMMINMLIFIVGDMHPSVELIIETIQYDLEKLNYEIKAQNGKCIIIQKDPAAVAVADVVEPNVGDSIIRYNHYVLKGNIEEKRKILISIASALEPKRNELNSINSSITSDFFYMVNNMNVRHNNIDPEGTQYKPSFAKLNRNEVEEWYDNIYQQGLLAFLLLEQNERTRKIYEYKKTERNDN